MASNRRYQLARAQSDGSPGRRDRKTGGGPRPPPHSPSRPQGGAPGGAGGPPPGPARAPGGGPPPALELPLVPQGGAGEGRDGHRRGPFGVAGEQTRDARLVVVLQEADEPRLVGELGAQVTADAGHVPADDPVIEPLVVTEVEA